MKKPHITIHDIAKELNISASTVSRALNNNPRISEATRDAVQQLASSYNYQPNVMASSLRKGESKTVGVIVPRINRNFFSNVIGGMEETLAAAGYHLIICQSHEMLKNEEAAVKTLIHARVDAILISVSMETRTPDHLTLLREKNIRLLFFDRKCDLIQAGSAGVNDLLGAYLNVKHLIDMGYRKIFHIAGPDHINIYRARKEGYIKAMAEAGIDIGRDWILDLPMVLSGGEAAFHRSMQLTEKPDAFFCSGDYAALGVFQAAKKRGLKIPDELGITGFGNEPFTEFLEPSLTTVNQQGQKMGRIVARMFLQNGNNENSELAPERMELEPELIIRNSSLLKK